MPATPPTFLIKPRTQYVKEGETATLRCLAKGQPAPKVTWEKDGKTIDPSGKHRIYTENQFFCLDIVNADATDRGIFVCVITNSVGTASEVADVDVTAVSAATPASTAVGRSDSAAAEAEVQRQPPAKSRRDEASAAVAKGSGGGPACLAAALAAASPAQPCPSGNALAVAATPGGRCRRSLPLSPRFTKHLRTEEEVLEGETVIIEVQTVTWFDELQQQPASRDSAAERHVLPRFTKPLENCDVCEGDAVTLECRGQRPPSEVACSNFVERSFPHPPEAEAVGAPATTASNGGGASVPPEGGVADVARPQFVKELVNVVLNEGDSVTLQCVTGAGVVDEGGSLMGAMAESSASGARDANGEAAVRDQQDEAAGADQREYNAPFFIIQLPSALTLEEGANMDVSCHVKDAQVESLCCHDSSIASF